MDYKGYHRRKRKGANQILKELGFKDNKQVMAELEQFVSFEQEDDMDDYLKREPWRGAAIPKPTYGHE